MFGLKSAGDASGIAISGKASSGNYTLLDTTDGHTHKVTLASTNSGGDGFTIDPNGLYLFILYHKKIMELSGMILVQLGICLH